MKTLIATIAALTISVLPAAAWPKGAISRIVIRGPGLDQPLEITDPDVLGRFTIWSGPGVGGWEEAYETPGFDDKTFADWRGGAVSERPAGMPSYEVAMYIEARPPPRNTYEVRYEFNASSDGGYIYLPKRGDELGAWNTWLIYRRVEGQWFHASRQWQEQVKPLIERQRRGTRGR